MCLVSQQINCQLYTTCLPTHTHTRARRGARTKVYREATKNRNTLRVPLFLPPPPCSLSPPATVAFFFYSLSPFFLSLFFSLRRRTKGEGALTGAIRKLSCPPSLSPELGPSPFSFSEMSHLHCFAPFAPSCIHVLLLLFLSFLLFFLAGRWD